MLASALSYSAPPTSRNHAVQDVTLTTPAGAIRTRLHRASEGGAGIVWVCGAGGGLGGPAGGMYERLAGELLPEGVLSLQVAYRQPGRLRPCVEDTLTGVAFVQSMGVERVVLAGHSFGGAVVINAGILCAVIGVAALSSQTSGAQSVVRDLSPKPLLLMHGEADEILSASCSRSLYQAAGEPKELRVYPGCLHGLDQCRDAVDRDLTAWLLNIFELG